ncbi:MAG: D-amino-acid transaminase [Rhodobacteraceae bacterium]|nr:D-amino-acid transaminase [Paracoccaceae bacterium]
MTRTIFCNGKFVPESEAVVSVLDRGFLFADAVYEVTSVLEGKLIDFNRHMARLRRSLAEIELTFPVSDEQLLDIHRELLKRNEVRQGLVYLQVSRGVAERDFVMSNVEPTLVVFTQKKDLLGNSKNASGYRIVTVPDLRWGRRDIKTVQLLYPSMAKMIAVKAGADDAWLVEDGFVTEGSSNNAYIVEQSGDIVTRNLSNSILAGITRQAVLEYAKEAGIKIVERPFTVAEAKNAAEAFATAASLFVVPVVEIDGDPIGNGKPGPVAQRLRDLYLEECRKRAF